MKNKNFPLILVAILGLVGVTVYMVNKPPKDETPNETNQTTQEAESTETKPMQEKPKYVDITPTKAQELIENTSDLIIIDVSPKYDEGHIPGAINYYVGDGSLDEAIPTLDKEATYLVYCHVDSAAIAGATKLIEAGFEKVYRLEGNYSAWVDAGFEIEN